eukprot:5845308-Amphidinium_carterae.1
MSRCAAAISQYIFDCRASFISHYPHLFCRMAFQKNTRVFLLLTLGTVVFCEEDSGQLATSLQSSEQLANCLGACINSC